MADENVSLELKAENSQYMRAINESIAALQRLGKAIADTNQQTTGFGVLHETAAKSVDSFGKSISNAAGEVQKFTTHTAAMFAAMLAYKVFEAAADAIANFGKALIGANAAAETWGETLKIVIQSMGTIPDRSAAVAANIADATRQSNRSLRDLGEQVTDEAAQFASRRQAINEGLTKADGSSVAERLRVHSEALAAEVEKHEAAVTEEIRLHGERRDAIVRDLATEGERFSQEWQDREKKFSQAWTDMQAKHQEVQAALSRQQDDNNRDYQHSLDERKLKWDIHLEEQQNSHAKSLQTIRDQMDDVNRTLADRITDIDQEYGDKRSDMEQSIQNKRREIVQQSSRNLTAVERRRLQVDLQNFLTQKDQERARLDRDTQQAKDRAERENAERLSDLARRVTRENEQFLAQQRFQEAEHTLESTALTMRYNDAQQKLVLRITEENRLYKEQQDRLDEDYLEDVRKIQKRHEEARVALEFRLDQENEKFAAASEYRQGVWDAEQNKRQEAYTRADADAAKAEADRVSSLQRQLADLDRAHAKAIRDMGEREQDLLEDRAKAVEKATRAGPERAPILQLFKDMDIVSADAATKIKALEDLLDTVAAETPFKLDKLKKLVLGVITTGIDPTVMVSVVNNAGEVIKRRWLDLTADWLAGARLITSGAEDSIMNFFRFVQGGRFGEAMENLRSLGFAESDLEAFGVRFDSAHELIEGHANLINAALQLVQQKFGGVAKAQSETAEGLISNLQDIGLHFTKLAGAPMFEQLRLRLLELYKAASSQEVKDRLTEISTAFGVTLVNAFKAVADIGAQLLPLFFGLKKSSDENLTPLQATIMAVNDALTIAWTFIQENWPSVQQGIDAVYQTFRVLWAMIAEHGPEMQAVLEKVRQGFQLVSDWVQEHSEGLKALGVIIAALAVGLGVTLGTIAFGTAIAGMAAFVAATWPFLLAIGAAVTAIGLLAKAWEEDWGGIRTQTAEIAAWWGDFFDAVGTRIHEETERWAEWWNELGRQLEENGAFNNLKETWRVIVEEIGPKVLGLFSDLFRDLSAGQSVLEGAASGIDIVSEEFTPLNERVATAARGIKSVTDNMLSLINGVNDFIEGMKKVEDALNGIQKAANKTGLVIHEELVLVWNGLPGRLDKAAEELGKSVQNWLFGEPDGLVARFQRFDVELMKTWNALLAKMFEAVRDFFIGPNSLIGKTWGWLVTDSDSLVARVGNTAPAMLEAMKSVGTNSMDGFKQGLVSAIPGVDWFRDNVVNKMVSNTNAAAQAGSPSLVMARGPGKNLGEGIVQGMGDEISMNGPIQVTAMINSLRDTLLPISIEDGNTIGTAFGKSMIEQATEIISQDGVKLGEQMGKIVDGNMALLTKSAEDFATLQAKISLEQAQAGEAAEKAAAISLSNAAGRIGGATGGPLGITTTTSSTEGVTTYGPGGGAVPSGGGKGGYTDGGASYYVAGKLIPPTDWAALMKPYQGLGAIEQANYWASHPTGMTYPATAGNWQPVANPNIYGVPYSQPVTPLTPWEVEQITAGYIERGLPLSFAEGGWVPGNPGEQMLAKLHAREFVIPADLADQLSHALSDRGGGTDNTAGGMQVSGPRQTIGAMIFEQHTPTQRIETDADAQHLLWVLNQQLQASQ